MTNIQSGQLDLIRDDCDRAFGVSDAESVGEQAMREKRPSIIWLLGPWCKRDLK
jgi:hypothetical protein